MSNHHALISGEYDNILGYEFRPIRAYRDNAKPFLEYLRNLKAEGKKKLEQNELTERMLGTTEKFSDGGFSHL